ncbi:hypothetical protein K402DRAFT_399171 [Aulographum hederae CBS 113979]|uniref:Uncharacterized protein n=1 Tax=Aulographum hederae CBS 113979 TaxID=1176131 RepID=A0A6G1GJ36_9PEZI|nr:hypothetical protein K402DRAFT_399171 [Aulographum hederae CBS 113979]
MKKYPIPESKRRFDEEETPGKRGRAPEGKTQAIYNDLQHNHFPPSIKLPDGPPSLGQAEALSNKENQPSLGRRQRALRTNGHYKRRLRLHLDKGQGGVLRRDRLLGVRRLTRPTHVSSSVRLFQRESYAGRHGCGPKTRSGPEAMLLGFPGVDGMEC